MICRLESFNLKITDLREKKTHIVEQKQNKEL